MVNLVGKHRVNYRYFKSFTGHRAMNGDIKVSDVGDENSFIIAFAVYNSLKGLLC